MIYYLSVVVHNKNNRVFQLFANCLPYLSLKLAIYIVPEGNGIGVGLSIENGCQIGFCRFATCQNKGNTISYATKLAT